MRSMKRTEEAGFTLIELLVVILIIAILAAIAIPVFLRQREQGYVDQMQSSLKNAATAIESYAGANNGDYTGATTTGSESAPAALADHGYRPTQSVTLQVSGDTDSYCIEATHSQFGDAWRLSSASGAPQQGACSGGADTGATT